MQKSPPEVIDRMGNLHNMMVSLLDQSDLNPVEILAVLAMLHERVLKTMMAEIGAE
jgi:hypothetical protein